LAVSHACDMRIHTGIKLTLLAVASIICNHPAVSSDIDRILGMVKEKTGYPAIVSLEPNMSLHSKMNAATKSAPVHVIFLNPQYDGMSNFLVAMQSAMILYKWANPTRIPKFTVSDDRMNALAKKVAPGNTGEMLIPGFVQPLLLQLVSMPLQIMTSDWLYKEFPGLRDEQISYMTADLREASRCLSPEVKKIAPKPVFENSISMGSAYALWWSQIEGSQVALLPYKVMGYLDKGQELLDALNTIPADNERWMKVVDAWAKKLGLNGYYQWQFENP